MVYNKRSINLEENTRLIRSSDHCLRKDKLILASLSNHEDNDDMNVTHSHNKQYRNNERFARAFFNCASFDVVLALSTSWNDLFCRWADNVSTWRQIFNSCSYLQTSHTNLIQGKCVLSHEWLEIIENWSQKGEVHFRRTFSLSTRLLKAARRTTTKWMYNYIIIEKIMGDLFFLFFVFAFVLFALFLASCRKRNRKINDRRALTSTTGI